MPLCGVIDGETGTASLTDSLRRLSLIWLPLFPPSPPLKHAELSTAEEPSPSSISSPPSATASTSCCSWASAMVPCLTTCPATGCELLVEPVFTEDFRREATVPAPVSPARRCVTCVGLGDGVALGLAGCSSCRRPARRTGDFMLCFGCTHTHRGTWRSGGGREIHPTSASVTESCSLGSGAEGATRPLAGPHSAPWHNAVMLLANATHRFAAQHGQRARRKGQARVSSSETAR